MLVVENTPLKKEKIFGLNNRPFGKKKLKNKTYFQISRQKKKKTTKKPTNNKCGKY